MSKKPIHQIKLRSVSAAVFENETQNGSTFPVVQIKRNFHDGNQWIQSDSYSFDDLLVLQQVVELSVNWMRSQLIVEHNARPTRDPS